MGLTARTAARAVAIIAVAVAFGAPSSGLLPTAGGEANADPIRVATAAFVQSQMDRVMSGCEFTDPWQCANRDSDGDGIPDIQDACPSQPGTGDGCPNDGNNFGCAAGYVLTTYGFYSGFVSLLAPEPVVSKAYGAAALVTGLAGLGLQAAFCD